MKARDIIPGWPRGRSTSRHEPFRFFAHTAEDLQVHQVEERRKADMMEEFYDKQRLVAQLGIPHRTPRPGVERDLAFKVVVYRMWARSMEATAFWRSDRQANGR